MEESGEGSGTLIGQQRNARPLIVVETETCGGTGSIDPYGTNGRGGDVEIETWRWAGFCLVLASIGTTALSAQDGSPLPTGVREWLERDQVQRWAQMIEEGNELFHGRSCVRCHGEGGKEGRWGPDLTDSEWVQSDGDLQGIWETIFWGVRREDFSDSTRRFEMNPGGGARLEWDELSAVAAYVWSLSNGTYLPTG